MHTYVVWVPFTLICGKAPMTRTPFNLFLCVCWEGGTSLNSCLYPLTPTWSSFIMEAEINKKSGPRTPNCAYIREDPSYNSMYGVRKKRNDPKKHANFKYCKSRGSTGVHHHLMRLLDYALLDPITKIYWGTHHIYFCASNYIYILYLYIYITNLLTSLTYLLTYLLTYAMIN